MQRIRKAVIPAAGFGTRFLPATKAQPKEMLPILDKPVIQFVVEEAIASGIDDIVIITGRGKRAVEDHFDYSPELMEKLEKKGDKRMIETLNNLTKSADIHYIRQAEQKGLGDAIYCARKHIGGEPFAVLLGDEIIDSKVPCIKQLEQVFVKYQRSIIGVLQVPIERIRYYGCIKYDNQEDGIFSISDVVEKPTIQLAPSNIAIDGRYILTPKIFDCIESTKAGYGGEIQLTDSIKELLKYEPIYATTIEGKRYDVGSKLDYAKAFFDFTMKNEDFSAEYKSHVKNYLGEHP